MSQFNFTSATIDGVTIGTTSTLIAAASSSRKILRITNDSNEDIYIAEGTQAQLNKGTRLNRSGGIYQTDGDYPFKGAIYGICLSGGKNVCITYA